MDNSNLALNWLRSIGKEEVQSFQDNFSGIFEISLCLISLTGEPLTVWSSESLFCHYTRSRNRDRCQIQRQQLLKKMCGRGLPVMDTCYMGMTSFLCPVLSDRKPIAAFLGGGVDTGDCRVRVNEDFMINPMPIERMKEISRFLHSVISMISPGHVPPLLEGNPDDRQLINRFGLTPREFTVVEQIMTGKSNKEIGGTLFISEKTVKSHITNILRKMQAKDRRQVILICKNYFRNR